MTRDRRKHLEKSCFLKKLFIKRCGWIENAELEFGASPGLYILWGESGSGKSMILDSVALAHGVILQRYRGMEFDIEVNTKCASGKNKADAYEIAIRGKRVFSGKTLRSQYFINGEKVKQNMVEKLFRENFAHQGQFSFVEIKNNFKELILDYSGLREEYTQIEELRSKIEFLKSVDVEALKNKLDEVEFQLSRVDEEVLEKSWDEVADEVANLEGIISGYEKILKFRDKAIEFLNVIFGIEFEAVDVFKSQNLMEAFVSLKESLEFFLDETDRKLSEIEDVKVRIEEARRILRYMEDIASIWQVAPFELQSRYEELILKKKKLERDLEVVENELENLKYYEDEFSRSCAEFEGNLKDSLKKLKLELESASEKLGLGFEIDVEVSSVVPLEVKLLFRDDRGDRDVEKLSGGERQRLMLALSSLLKVNIMLLDEPAAGLDEENATKLVEFLKESSRNKQIVVVTHNRVIRDAADCVFEIKHENGKVQVRRDKCEY